MKFFLLLAIVAIMGCKSTGELVIDRNEKGEVVGLQGTGDTDAIKAQTEKEE